MESLAIASAKRQLRFVPWLEGLEDRLQLSSLFLDLAFDDWLDVTGCRKEDIRDRHLCVFLETQGETIRTMFNSAEPAGAEMRDMSGSDHRLTGLAASVIDNAGAQSARLAMMVNTQEMRLEADRSLQRPQPMTAGVARGLQVHTFNTGVGQLPTPKTPVGQKSVIGTRGNPTGYDRMLWIAG